MIDWKWIRSIDRLPEKHQRVLVCDDGVVFIYYLDTPILANGELQWCESHRDLTGYEIAETYWMPLPYPMPPWKQEGEKCGATSASQE